MSGAVVVIGTSPVRLLQYYKFLGSYARLQGGDPDDFASWVMDTYRVNDDFISQDVDVRELFESFTGWKE